MKMDAQAKKENIYAKVVIKGHPFTVTKNDLIVTHRLKGPDLGDVLKIDQAFELGTKDYTFKGKPLIHKSLFNIYATVIENGRGEKIWAKRGYRAKGRRKKVSIKPHTTTLRVSEISINI